MTPRLLALFVPALAISLACGGSGSTRPDFDDVFIDVADTPTADASGAFIPAPALGVTDWVKGDEVDLASADNVVLVEHWATWCGPCKVEMPHLTELQAEHADTLTIVGVSDEDVGTVRPFVTRNDEVMGYTVAAAPLSAMRNWTDLSGATGIPYSYLVKANEIVWHGHPASLGAVLPHVLSGTWDAAMAKTYAELPTLVSAYRSAIDIMSPEHARATVEPLVEMSTLGADAKNELSWGILTEVAADKRDHELALILAEQATDELNHESWAYEDTLGLALWVNDRHAEAVAAQQTAVDLCDAARAGAPCTELRERLVAYEDGSFVSPW